MKSKACVLAALTAALFATGCGGLGVLDNYDKPTSTISGKLTYQTATLGLKSNEVQLELWQPGYALYQKIAVYVDQDGTFSATVFDGDYKLNLMPNSGPFVDIRDTIPVQLRGKATVDVPVTPYYTINNVTFTHKADSIQATFTLGMVNTTKLVDLVGLYLSNTSIVDRQYYSVRKEVTRTAIPNLNGTITLTAPLGALAGRSDVFARVGVKTVGLTPYMYGPVVKQTL